MFDFLPDFLHLKQMGIFSSAPPILKLAQKKTTETLTKEN